MGAASGLTTYAGDILADIIEPLAKIKEPSIEAQSTEEVRRIIEDASERSKSEGVRNLVTASMDVVALYPSLNQRESAREVAQEFLDSGLQVE